MLSDTLLSRIDFVFAMMPNGRLGDTFPTHPPRNKKTRRNFSRGVFLGGCRFISSHFQDRLRMAGGHF